MDGLRPFGLYRYNLGPLKEGHAKVRFEVGDISVPEAIYRAQGYRPPFRDLPVVHAGVVQDIQSEAWGRCQSGSFSPVLGAPGHDPAASTQNDDSTAAAAEGLT